MQDLRYAFRMLLRAPGFTAATVLTLALGIGANSAIFGIVQGVLIESLPFPAADRLYRLRTVYPDGRANTTLSAPDFMSVREGTRCFEQVAAYTTGAVTMLGGGEPREVRAASISDGLFDLLGVRVMVGRPFERGEHTPGRNAVAILDHGFWQGAFGGDEGVIDRAIVIGGIPYTVVGVLAPGARLPADVPGARLPSEADLYLPLQYDEAFSATAATRRSSRSLGVLARAEPGANARVIDEDLRRIGAELRSAFPESNGGLSLNAISARDLIVGDIRRPLLFLLGAVGFVLLVACANVASLMLARSSARQQELTIRASLGAGRRRLMRQLLTEAAALGVLGGALGIAFAYAGTQMLVAAQPADIPRLEEVRLDIRVVLFTLGISLCASLAFGVLPALQATGHLTRSPRAGGRDGGADRRTVRARAGLVVTEIALAMVLLMGAGLFLRSLAALTQVAPGFTPENTMAFRVALFGRGYDPDTVRARVSELESQLRALPGVTAAAATSVLPLSGPGPRLLFSVDGAPPPASNVNPEIGVTTVTPEYFKTIGARLVRGRDFSDRDSGDAPPVAIVNEAAVRRWFEDGQPIGRRVRMNGVREIIGVVGDLQQGNPKQQTEPQLFVANAQRPARSMWIVLRATTPPAVLATAARATLRRLDPDLALSELTSLDQLRARAAARPRFYTTSLGIFALVGLVLAATGIFGVTSYTVAERTREIGVRIAVGAQVRDVRKMFLRDGLLLTAAGLAIGIGMALALARVISTFLFGVGPMDLVTYAAVSVVLAIVALLATYVPACRASRVDPLVALRADV